MERWHPETNSFHFSWGEMTITLHDVQIILGVPIEGTTPYTMRTENQIVVEVSRITGWTIQDISKWLRKDSGIELKTAMEKLKEMIRNGAPDESIAKVYMFIALAATLFFDKSRTRGAIWVFGLCLDLQLMRKFSWGMGCLAWLYRALGKASCQNTKSIDGCTWILRVRINLL